MSDSLTPGTLQNRGDKLTKRVWQEILSGEYVAQEFVTQGERKVSKRDPG